MSRCLSAKEVAEDHNAESLAKVLQEIFDEWAVTGKVYGATTDNGGNIVNACVNHLKLTHMPCIGHTLQLAVKRALEINKVRRALGRCRKCVEHFHKSTKATYKLREKQELLKIPQHALVQDCITRWGSTLHMLQRLQEQQAAIAATLMESKDTHLMPEGSEWKIIDQLVEVLTPFNLATETMSGEKYPTISMIIPLLHKLLNVTLKVSAADDACTKEIKEAISTDLCRRYQSTTTQKLLKVATYLDPRCKSLPFLSDTEKNFVIEDLEDYLSAQSVHEELKSTQSNNNLEETNKDLSEVSELSAPPTKKVKKITKLLGDIFKCSQTPQTPLEEIKSEIHRYKLEEPLDLESDPLKWWLQRHTTYPHISSCLVSGSH